MVASGVAVVNWLFEQRILPSEKNGRIVVRRLLGRFKVTVDGYDQSSHYIRSAFARALDRLPSTFQPKRVLMLGLGAGRLVDLLYEHFPNCTLTAIEWDPVMIQLMDELHLYKPYPRPNIIVGDAANIIHELEPGFDFILVDLFKGPNVISSLFEPAMIQRLSELMSTDGLLLFNLFRQPELLVHFDAVFDRLAVWDIGYNQFALYKPKTFSSR